MSNPYGPPSGDGADQPPYGSTPPPPPGPGPYDPPATGGDPGPYGQPYGQPAAPQYGSPYGSGGGYGSPPPPPGMGAKGGADGISIAAFVLSLTCCLSVVGLIMGFFGLKRTKNNQRGARWAAIASIPIGILGTLVLIGGIIGVVWFANNTLSLDEAKVGQCITIDDSDNDAVILYKKDCSDKHEGEIVYAGKVGDDTAELSGSAATQVCFNRATSLLSTLDETKFTLHALTEDPDDISSGDALVCYVETNGSKYTGKAADQ